MSSTKYQLTGVPQSSTLSVTLFAIKINSLANAIPSDVFSSLFVNVVLITNSGHNPDVIERKLQDAVNRIAQLEKFNGFRFSPTKTTMVEFFEKNENR